MDKYLTKTTIFCLIVIFTSCTTIFFDTPQPIDSSNLYYFPNSLQGEWFTKSKDSIIINDSSFHQIDNIEHKFAMQHFDSLKYYIVDNKIHIINRIDIKPKDTSTISALFNVEIDTIKIEGEEDCISKQVFYFDTISDGIAFTLTNDTLLFYEREEFVINISDSTFFRSARNCFVLNRKINGWWEVFVIKKMKNKEIHICMPHFREKWLLKSNYNLEIIDSTNRDSVLVHAEFKSKKMGKKINYKYSINSSFLDKNNVKLIILKPDSTFYNPNK